jgi:predicted HTH transcriptional regulator
MAAVPPTPPEFDHPARRPSERLAIVAYVHATPALQETDYLEWKTEYDLSSRPGAAATAKQLIGMANRDLSQAMRHNDGYAYILLGVEPENLVGVTLWDSADIENWLGRFVGPDLRYDIHYVELHQKQILFLTVDAPKQGDPIYCLQHASTDPDGEE